MGCSLAYWKFDLQECPLLFLIMFKPYQMARVCFEIIVRRPQFRVSLKAEGPATSGWVRFGLRTLLIASLTTVTCAVTSETPWHWVILFPRCRLINKGSLKFRWSLNIEVLALCLGLSHFIDTDFLKVEEWDKLMSVLMS